HGRGRRRGFRLRFRETGDAVRELLRRRGQRLCQGCGSGDRAAGQGELRAVARLPTPLVQILDQGPRSGLPHGRSIGAGALLRR
ncbi:unnamed protein product, partial [Ectocarpus sp. 6 AP-2014]